MRSRKDFQYRSTCRSTLSIQPPLVGGVAHLPDCACARTYRPPDRYPHTVYLRVLSELADQDMLALPLKVIGRRGELMYCDQTWVRISLLWKVLLLHEVELKLPPLMYQNPRKQPDSSDR